MFWQFSIFTTGVQEWKILNSSKYRSDNVWKAVLTRSVWVGVPYGLLKQERRREKDGTKEKNMPIWAPEQSEQLEQFLVTPNYEHWSPLCIWSSVTGDHMTV